MFRAIPPVSRALILLNFAIYGLELVAGNVLLGLFALWPAGSPYFHPWQLLTYAFLHDPHSVWHVLVNMFGVFMFGGTIERYFGARRYLLYYLICALSAGVTQLAVTYLMHSDTPTVGASGALFGILLAFAWYFPQQKVIFVLFPVPLSAWFVVAAYAAFELYSGVTGRHEGIAHFAHLGGMLGGILCILYWNARRRFSSAPPRQS
jgi:membrane associated rhomboid family serine protease